ncbi:putative thiamine transport system substrate-binding protein [Amorphus orientalis]|uniref:Thiamine transport system substrate-binding protein n=1 Tax=Amorphus orientalis TaxID=649198 RepID=A0AAE3VP31_9HYPH|nr:ABC transporter substrate-binding protein [Amorphus orientalis]MDQ0315190.1 putative thiamine transport system substrate-binding protein [Amorphus orientalis]
MTFLKILLAKALLALAFAVSILPAASEVPNVADWENVEKAAEGQTVYFHAWGGEPRINAYIRWAAAELKARYGIELVHVKVDDIAQSVSQVLAEKIAGRNRAGEVDLIWINGENFAAMRENNLLMRPGWADKLPNWRYVDTEDKPTTTVDFTIPTKGLESPWGMAQLVFLYDSAQVEDPPRTLDALVDFVAANPGRFTYPQPPDFLGNTFLKQLLVTLAPDPEVLSRPVSDDVLDETLTPVFDYLERLRPNLWRRGQTYPRNVAENRRLFADSEVEIAMTFNPADASAAIENKELPDTVRPYVLDGGTIGNSHFVAIPFNSDAKPGALVTANFLLSPEAQAIKADPRIWGDPTVLNVAELPVIDQTLFADADENPAMLSASELAPTLSEPHPSWTEELERAWLEHYGTN